MIRFSSFIFVFLQASIAFAELFCTDGHGTAPSGFPCHFPFRYDGVTYNECIDKGQDGRSWCATTDDYDRDREWGGCGFCDQSATKRTEMCTSEVGTVLTGTECVFPFVYMGKAYYECTMDDNEGVPWCAVVHNMDDQDLWGQCAPCSSGHPDDSEPVTFCAKGDGTAPADTPCFFPFWYNGAQHFNCTSEDWEDGTWCSTLPDFDESGSWGSCVPCGSVPREQPGLLPMPPSTKSNFCAKGDGTAPPDTPCYFPFSYDGMLYYSCTDVEWEHGTWCSTTPDFDKSNSWGSCVICVSGADPESSSTTSTSNPETEPEPEEPKPAPRLDVAYCAKGDGSAPPNTPCHFPFTYNGVSYDRCTTADWEHGAWCSTMPSFEESLSWGSCVECNTAPMDGTGHPSPYPGSSTFCAQGDGTAEADTPCYFPFYYDGKWYDSCTTQDWEHGAWCSTTPNFDTAGKWGSCIYCDSKEEVYISHPSEEEGFSEVARPKYCVKGDGTAPAGTPCQFPFYYNEVVYFGCTDAEWEHGTWCSTTEDFDVDMSWGTCVLCGEEETSSPFSDSDSTSTSSKASSPSTSSPSEEEKGSEVSRPKYCVKGDGTAPAGTPCEFPFHYNGIAYFGCTDVEWEHGTWCSTTPDFDLDESWGTCVPCDEVETSSPFASTTSSPSEREPEPHGNLEASGFCALGDGTAPPNTRCWFPFKYDGKMYDNCTSADWQHGTWCSTTPDFDESMSWGSCVPCTAGPAREYIIGQLSDTYCAVNGTVADGTPCMFPFYYEGEPFFECVGDNGPKWCGTSSVDVAGSLPEWGNCVLCPGAKDPGPPPAAIELLKGETRPRFCTGVDGTAPPNSECVFPFRAFHRTYYNCTTDANSGVPWCATSHEEDEMQLWGNCVPCQDEVEPAVVPTMTPNAVPSAEFCIVGSGTAEVGDHCVFPFEYNGNVYDGCTTVDSENEIPWCATSQYEGPGQEWGRCGSCADAAKIAVPPNPLNGQVCVDGQGSALVGTPCHFPFIYHSQKFDSCISDDNEGKPWCATTRNVDVDFLWGNCVPCPTIPAMPVIEAKPEFCIAKTASVPCVFPFVFDGVLHEQCIESKGVPGTWCSTTSNFDADQSWGYCGPCEEKHGSASICAHGFPGAGGNPEGKCAFPFQYRGKSYSECITEDNDGKPWCSTTSNFDEDLLWGPCVPCPIAPPPPVVVVSEPVHEVHNITTVITKYLPLQPETVESLYSRTALLIALCGGLFLGVVVGFVVYKQRMAAKVAVATRSGGIRGRYRKMGDGGEEEEEAENEADLL